MTIKILNSGIPAVGRLPRPLLMLCALLVSFTARGQQAPAASPPPATGQPTIESSWNALLNGAVPESKPDPALTVTQVPSSKGSADDFLNHFFYETRTAYIRENVSFTGDPTVTGVINVAPTASFNPSGIPYPAAFQPSANSIDSFMDFGTRGWISDRVNTHFSFRYRQNLTHITDASPELGILNTFGSDRQIEMTTGYVEINGRATDGAFKDTSLQFGRINVYGAELATMDGAAFTVNRRDYTYTLFAGRRYSYFSDPDQRVVGGGNFLFRLGENSSFEYNNLYYIKDSHTFTFRRRFSPRWLFNSSYKMIGGSPIDFNTNAIWSPADGKTTIHLRFAQKITNKDFIYDYAINARDLAPNNPLQTALYLGPISPHSEFLVDARRTVNSRLRLGATVWVRRLNDTKDEGPFDTSFTDYHAEAQIYPVRQIELYLDFRQHNSDRSAPFPSTNFEDISIAGETRIQDYSAQIGRSFLDGRLTLRGGGFYRRMGFQDRFYIIENTNDKGVIGNITARLDQHTRLYFDYNLDTDFIVFRPSIGKSQVMRLGVAWRL